MFGVQSSWIQGVRALFGVLSYRFKRNILVREYCPHGLVVRLLSDIIVLLGPVNTQSNLVGFVGNQNFIPRTRIHQINVIS